MLEDLFKLVQSHAQDAVVNNPDVPNEKNDAVIADATHSVAEGFQGALAGGGLQNVISMFAGGGGNSSSLLNNPVVSNIISSFTNKLTNDHGVNNAAASGIASSLIPTVINSLISKVNDPNNSSFTLDNLLHSITGGQSSQVAAQQQPGFSFQNLISEFTGGGNGGGGGLMNIVSQLAGGAQSQQQGGGGGLMDMIKGFMK
ncbi:MAG: hypothetical protein JST86_02740 [Bacteroidetes bacterium]|nr:hypothetical protein [Bacteroidota bacterium]